MYLKINPTPTNGFNLHDVSALCFNKAETAAGSADLTAKNSADIGMFEALGFAPRFSNNWMVFCKCGFL